MSKSSSSRVSISSEDQGTLVAFLDGQPINATIACEVLEVCDNAVKAMEKISKLIVAYTDAPWYNVVGTGSRRCAIKSAHYDLFRKLDLLNTKTRCMYEGRSNIETPMARWAEEIQKSASRFRQYAAWLESRASAPADEYTKVYNEMLDVYELHRLNLNAVMGTMTGLLSSLDARDKRVWQPQANMHAPPLWRWMSDAWYEADFKPLKRV